MCNPCSYSDVCYKNDLLPVTIVAQIILVTQGTRVSCPLSDARCKSVLCSLCDVCYKNDPLYVTLAVQTLGQE